VTVTVDTPTDSETIDTDPLSADGPAGTEAGPSPSPDLPVDTPTTPTASPAAPQPGPPPAPGARSDDELLAVLDREIQRTGQRPSRKQVMGLTRVGNDRAIRLLARLDEQHDWARPAPAKRGTARRAGRAARPRPAPPTSSEAASDTGTGPDTPGGTGVPQPVPAAPAIAPVPQVSAPGTESGHGGRLVSWSGFVFGSVTSVAFNVLAARIPPVHAPAHWTPSIVAEVFAAVWPLALLLSVEVLSRVRMPSDWYWKLAKIGGSVAVAGGSAVISYGHINDVLTSWNYSGIGAGVGPLVIDGLMIISGFALLALSHRAPVPADQAGTR
jgi:hypothetical protein